MRVLIQKSQKSSVIVDNKVVGKIAHGLVVFSCFEENDGPKQIEYLAKKICNLRIFRDEAGKMNLNLKDVGGELLLISQFTLYGDASHGNRPSFTSAAKPEFADKLYEYFCEKCAEKVQVEKGKFRTHMKVELINDGPVTIILEK